MLTSRVVYIKGKVFVATLTKISPKGLKDVLF